MMPSCGRTRRTGQTAHPAPQEVHIDFLSMATNADHFVRRCSGGRSQPRTCEEVTVLGGVVEQGAEADEALLSSRSAPEPRSLAPVFYGQSEERRDGEAPHQAGREGSSGIHRT